MDQEPMPTRQAEPYCKIVATSRPIIAYVARIKYTLDVGQSVFNRKISYLSFLFGRLQWKIDLSRPNST